MEVDDIYPLIPSPRKGGLPHVKKETVEKVIKYFDSFGTLEPAPRKKRARKMAPQHVAVLVEIVKKDPYLFLEEIATELTERTAVEYAVGRCYYELRSRGYCLKKMRKKARQRNERKRDLYWETIAELLGHTGSRRQLCFADETAKDTRALRRWRGWGLGGDAATESRSRRCCSKEKSFRYWHCTAAMDSLTSTSKSVDIKGTIFSSLPWA